VDLHAGQIQGFFNIPVDELTAAPILSSYFQRLAGQDLVVVATDVGDAKRARDMARLLNVPIAIIEKQRLGNQDKVQAVNLIGEVKGRKALIVDDEIGTGGTVLAAVSALTTHGASEVYCAATHALLNGEAAAKLRDSALKELVITDTVPVPQEKRFERMKVLSVASLLGEAIHRIHSGLSVGAMFDS
jgi:ribose-phosphate pyrophosphokinase